MRESGILMPVSSLPGNYGIGSFGKGARRFVDFLVKAGQTIWQVLPLSPTGYGDSPYQSNSAFAGNPYFIDLDTLAEEGLLKPADYKKLNWGADPLQVDYGVIYNNRFPVLRKAYANWKAGCAGKNGFAMYYPDDYYAFVFRSSDWLPDYALYMTAKITNGMKNWREWPEPLRLRDKAALEQLKADQADEIGFWTFLQYQFDRQWQALKKYANANGIQIVGDLPIYVSADSCDAWAGGKLFETDKTGAPRRVAGCPPDYFSADGQLWGNPLYDWAYHKSTGYAWWVSRLRHALHTYDLIRIDHFRGFDTYWAIPAGDKTARGGKWELGPGMDLFNTLSDKLGKLPIIAEDLGEMFPSVRKLLKDSGFPGMKVLQFAFSGGDSEYLPHNHIPNCVCYPGTHDNTTLQDWLDNAASRKELANVKTYLRPAADESLREVILRACLVSCAQRTIIPMSDWLGLGGEFRLNTPGKASGNWAARSSAGQFTPALAKTIRTRCELYGRFRPAPKAAEKPVEKAAVPAAEKPAEAAETVKKA